MSNKNIIVTGGAGYIGSHACKALYRAGFTPVTFDNLSRGHEWAVKWGPLEIGDILDSDRLSEVMKQYQPSAVMHFAALACVGESVTRPILYYHNNVVGTCTLLRTMLRHGINKFIFSSTCAVYGEPQELPLTESHQRSPVNPYGNTKAMVETMLEDLAAIDQLQFVSLRYFNAAGADADGDIGESHEPETHLIPLVLNAAAGAIPAIAICGDDYETKDGTGIRDYIHVTDLADAHVRALQRILDGNSSGFYNLGTETGYSVKEIIDAAEKVTKKKIPTSISPRRPGDPPALIANTTKVKQELGWKLKYSDLDSIISSAWNWHHNLQKKNN